MEYAKQKVVRMRRKVCILQMEILDLAHKYQTSDFKDPRIKSKHSEVTILETVLDGWLEIYKEEEKIFWK